MSAENKDGDRRSRRKRGGGTANELGKPTPQHSDDNPVGFHQRQVQNHWEQCYVELTGILSRADGWLRIVPGSDAKLIYVKWKYTLGRHSGTYVMAVSALWRFDEAIRTLIRKLEEVDAGTRRPTVDRAYDSYGDALPARNGRELGEPDGG